MIAELRVGFCQRGTDNDDRQHGYVKHGLRHYPNLSNYVRELYQSAKRRYASNEILEIVDGSSDNYRLLDGDVPYMMVNNEAISRAAHWLALTERASVCVGS